MKEFNIIKKRKKNAFSVGNKYITVNFSLVDAAQYEI